MSALTRERAPPASSSASFLGANRPGGRRFHVVQGEFHVTDDPEALLTTLLGSCVAACLRDPLAKVGGINHFLLPGREGADTLRYGVHAMELLVNGLLQRGAKRERMEAKLFGGAQIMDGLADIGGMNAAFAEEFLRKERIPLVGGSLRGARGRRVEYWPGSGRARQIFLERDATAAIAAERRAPVPAPDDGAVELF